MLYSNSPPNIVVLGGGTGSSSVLRGLKKQTDRLTAIVTMFDSGGSSGLLREEFGYPPMGDLRQCLVALSEDGEATEALVNAFEFRFRQDSSLNGHSVGNLLLAALTTLRNDIEGAIAEMSALLRLRGRVVPVALTLSDLCAELEDGAIVRGESRIDLRRMSLPRIKRVFLDPPASANPRAIEAILAADAVVMGPGDLYTSIIPNLLADGVPQALGESRAAVIYVCNLMTKQGETDNFKASDFAGEISRYLGGRLLDWVVMNTRPVPPRIRKAYAAESAYPVTPDRTAVQSYARHILAAPLSNNQERLRHDPLRLAEAVLTAISVTRGRNGVSRNGNGHTNGRHANGQRASTPDAIGVPVPPSAGVDAAS